jgi:hypothetical protein
MKNEIRDSTKKSFSPTKGGIFPNMNFSKSFEKNTNTHEIKPDFEKIDQENISNQKHDKYLCYNSF